jgi:hypothetical protein
LVSPIERHGWTLGAEAVGLRHGFQDCGMDSESVARWVVVRNSGPTVFDSEPSSYSAPRAPPLPYLSYLWPPCGPACTPKRCEFSRPEAHPAASESSDSEAVSSPRVVCPARAAPPDRRPAHVRHSTPLGSRCSSLHMDPSCVWEQAVCMVYILAQPPWRSWLRRKRGPVAL